MIPLILAMLLAGDAPPPPPPPPPAPEEIVTTPKSTDALVDAAKDAKAKRKSSSTKVITNSDVKKSKGKIAERKVPGGAEVTVTASRDTESPLAKQNREYRARLAAEARVEAAEAKLKEMEQAVSRLELAYFDENDPTTRDTIVTKRFADAVHERDVAKKQLDEAKADLAQLAPKQ